MRAVSNLPTLTARGDAYHPVERVVAPVADVDADFPERGFEHRVARVALRRESGVRVSARES